MLEVIFRTKQENGEPVILKERRKAWLGQHGKAPPKRAAGYTPETDEG